MPENLPTDPFDPACLRLDQCFADGAGVTRLITTVPVRKPNRQDFVRVHPDPTYRLTPAATSSCGMTVRPTWFCLPWPPTLLASSR
jgi:hypothetical protein